MRWNPFAKNSPRFHTVNGRSLPVITSAELAEQTPEDAAQLVMDRLHDAILADAKKKNVPEEHEEFETLVLTLPQPWRMVYLVFGFGGSVINSGHDGFFANHSEAWQSSTREGLVSLGATEYVAMYDAALPLHQSLPEDEEAPETDEIISQLDEIDERFYAQEVSPTEILGEYILANRSIYCTD